MSAGDLQSELSEPALGRALIDGNDNNMQAVDLCDEHWPIESEWNEKEGLQPHNCKHVRFYWPRVIPAGEK